MNAFCTIYIHISFYTFLYSGVFCRHKGIDLLVNTPEREPSGSLVECLTRDRRVAGSSLTGVTALCP